MFSPTGGVKANSTHTNPFEVGKEREREGREGKRELRD